MVRGGVIICLMTVSGPDSRNKNNIDIGETFVPVIIIMDWTMELNSISTFVPSNVMEDKVSKMVVEVDVVWGDGFSDQGDTTKVEGGCSLLIYDTVYD